MGVYFYLLLYTTRRKRRGTVLGSHDGYSAYDFFAADAAGAVGKTCRSRNVPICGFVAALIMRLPASQVVLYESHRD
jgi:hypothetical protein